MQLHRTNTQQIDRHKKRQVRRQPNKMALDMAHILQEKRTATIIITHIAALRHTELVIPHTHTYTHTHTHTHTHAHNCMLAVRASALRRNTNLCRKM